MIQALLTLAGPYFPSWGKYETNGNRIRNPSSKLGDFADFLAAASAAQQRSSSSLTRSVLDSRAALGYCS